MKLLLPVSVLAICFASCATPNPDDLENTIEVQTQEMYEKLEKARLREEKWDQRWENYSARQDQKYDAWLDRVFD